jgi:hypothetical protein
MFQEFPEYDRLLALATDGATIHTPTTGWAPNMGKGVVVRKVARQMADAVLVRVAEEQARGDLIVVPQQGFHEMAHKTDLEFNVIELGWVFKAGDKESDKLGRVVDDMSFSPSPINTPETAQMAREIYGPLDLPILADMCNSLLIARQRFPGQRLSGLKEDVSRAYRRVRIALSSCRWVVIRLPVGDDGVEYYGIRLSQPFGHTAAGYAWGVVARAIEWYLNREVAGVATESLYGMYVDDLYAFAIESLLRSLSELFTEACTVAGQDARDVKKSQISTRLESLGWMFIDDCDMVLPNKKGWLNLLSLFFSTIPWDVSTRNKMPVKVLMKLGSYASRYSQVFYPLRASCHGFYGNVQGASPFAVRALSARTVQDIWVWRMFLMLAHRQPAILSVPVSWPVVATWPPEQQAAHADRVVYVDASGRRRMCGAYVADSFWCQYVCPAQQYMYKSALVPVNINVLEMLGVIMGAYLTIMHIPDVQHVHIWCDNMSSVAWADSRRTDSALLCLCLQLLTLLGASRRVLITVGWIKGAENHMADAISREFQVPNGNALHQQLLQSPCTRLDIPTHFTQAIRDASRMRLCETFHIARLVRTLLVGKNF